MWETVGEPALSFDFAQDELLGGGLEIGAKTLTSHCFAMCPSLLGKSQCDFFPSQAGKRERGKEGYFFGFTACSVVVFTSRPRPTFLP
jgi:hypothetical protein